MNFWTEAQLRSIDRMLNPRSIAVVGASPKGGYGGRLLNAVMKAKDRVKIYPINPNYPEIHGVQAYPSISALPEAPDHVSIIVPHSKVLGVLQECVDKKAGSGVIISAGFSERDTEAGHDLQRKVSAFAKETGFRFTGPNCLGIANVRDNIWATASSRTLDGLTGNIALVCQSGATAFGPFLLRAVDSGIGLSHIISTGNEIDLDFSDFARYLVDDPETRVIAGFIEGFKSMDKFLAVAELAAEKGKPIVLIKIGRSESGAQAARSHTAALTGTDAMNDAVFKQFGVIRVQDYDELLEVSQLFSKSRKPKSPGVAVVSHSGGISSLTADMLGLAGLPLPPLTDKARDGINGIIKDFGWAANPADVTGFASRDDFVPIMDYMIDQPDVGTLVVASAGNNNQIQQVTALRDRTDKNIAFFWTASRLDTNNLKKLKDAQIPTFYTPDKLARGLRYLLDYHAWLDKRAATPLAKVPEMTAQQAAWLPKLSGRKTLPEKEGKQLLTDWGIPVPRELPAKTADMAVQSAELLGYPVVLKIDSADIPHKTEAGGVRVGLAGSDAVREAFDEIMTNAHNYAPNAKLDGVLVQEMVSGGVEMIAGVTRDPLLGPMLLVGSGGVMVEVYGDSALRHCPITKTEALDMIGEVKGAKLLQGFRGKPAGDIDALADALVRISHLAVHLGAALVELDVNPLVVMPKGRGVIALDALVLLEG